MRTNPPSGIVVTCACGTVYRTSGNVPRMRARHEASMPRARAVAARRAAGEPLASIARDLGVSVTTVHRLVGKVAAHDHRYRPDGSPYCPDCRPT